MPSRPVWQGHLRLSLVSCPVALYKATDEGGGVHFNLLHKDTLNRVKQFWRDAETNEEITRQNMVKGYQVERDRYVVIDDDELKALRLESTKTIDVERFVDGVDIDRLYWDQAYFLVPDGKPAFEPFAVIRDAMAKEDQVALGRLVMSSRERIVGIEVRGKGMHLSTLRTHEEVRSEAELFDVIPDVAVQPQMIDIARQIIGQAKGKFDPSEFKDRYADAVKELVASKAGSEHVVERSRLEEPAGNVIDLMEALRRSLAPPAAKDGPEQQALKKPARAPAKSQPSPAPVESKPTATRSRKRA